MKVRVFSCEFGLIQSYLAAGGKEGNSNQPGMELWSFTLLLVNYFRSYLSFILALVSLTISQYITGLRKERC